MSAPPATPHSFDDNLAVRGWQNRRGTIGNPYAYLANVGLDAILEKLYQGANLVDVAEALKVSVTILRTWLDNEGYWPKVEEATTLSSEGYLAMGQKLLLTAPSKFELDKAKALIEHARWMASKINKPVYGTVDVPAAATTVSYVFNVGGSAQIVAGHTPHALQKPEEDVRVLPVTFAVPGVAEPEVGPFADEVDDLGPIEKDFMTLWDAAG
jgi:hypothetical protein